MKYFAHGLKEFAHWKGDEFKRRRFLSGLMWVIEEHVEYTTACAVHIDDYDSVDQRYYLSEHFKPYTLACLTCAARILSHADADSTSYNRSDVVYFFEKGDTDQNQLRTVWLNLMPTLRVEPIFLEKCDAYPPGTKSRRIRQFEAADLVAYENLKGNTKIIEKIGAGESLFLDEFRKPLQRIAGTSGISEMEHSGC